MTESVAERGRCLLNLSGGSTPLALYRLLAQHPDLPWSDTHLFWGDERFVPVDHLDSNAGSAQQVLVERVPVPASQVYPWPILDTPENSAKAYEALLGRTAGTPPLFDITLLGLGNDCHTAGLFPGSGSMSAPGLTVHSRPPGTTRARLSLTAGALSRSRLVIFLVTGNEKREALAALLAKEGDPERCPARAISALERLLVVTDLGLES